MPVDEFGRQIPANPSSSGSAGRGPSPPRYFDEHPPHHQRPCSPPHGSGGSGGGGGGHHHHEHSRDRHHDRHYDRPPPAGLSYNNSNEWRKRPRSRSPPPSPLPVPYQERHHHQQERHQSQHRHRDHHHQQLSQPHHHRDHHQQQPHRHPLPPQHHLNHHYNPKQQQQQNQKPQQQHHQQQPIHHQNQNHHHPHHHRPRHPSKRYVEEPMLCEYVWKNQNQRKSGEDLLKGEDASANKESKKENEHEVKANDRDSNEKDNDLDRDVCVDDTQHGKGGKENGNKGNNHEREQDELDDKKSTSSTTNPSYDAYRRRYCLNYVRSFFNAHMDDSWFRSRYSPLGRKRVCLQERERARQEAKGIWEQIQNSQDEFVAKARLGTGVKSSSSGGTAGSSSPTKKRAVSMTMSSSIPGGGNGDSNANSLPKSHELLIVNNNILHVTDIPPHVTDDQLLLAMMDHCLVKDIEATSSVRIFSGAVSADRKKDPLWRDAYLVAPSKVREDILANLIKADAAAADAAAADAAAANSSQDQHKQQQQQNQQKEEAAPKLLVPRKEKHPQQPKLIPLDVECSDPYGRMDVDADGKGGAPEDGVGVPHRKSTVYVSTASHSQPVQVLSAALSSKERIPRDKDAAILIARALDVSKDIPKGYKLDDLLGQFFGRTEESKNQEDDQEEKLGTSSLPPEDLLDISIAYLRRVHLFSFYNGCTMSNSLADVLSGRHPAGTIHLRQKNADEILDEQGRLSSSVSVVVAVNTSAEDKHDEDIKSSEKVSAGTIDLLVKRLDDSIAKALDQRDEWMLGGGKFIINEEIDQQAVVIESSEEELKDGWLDKHAIIDDDGRARCSFHFCHKLFKDENFLRKHLLKKHREFLRAEMATLHDEYMMSAWDKEDNRPVPPILVDCGVNFDLVPSEVYGSEPIANDPEPEIWRKEEERRKRDEELQQERQEMLNHRQQQQRSRDQDHHLSSYRRGAFGGSGQDRNNNNNNNATSSSPPSQKNFVDVDDMKEEKIEMSFENVVDVIAQPPKKKKKKKKLL